MADEATDAVAAREQDSDDGQQTPLKAYVLYYSGRAHSQKGDHAEGAKLIEEAVDLCRAKHSDAHMSVINKELLLSQVLERIGNFQASREVLVVLQHFA